MFGMVLGGRASGGSTQPTGQLDILYAASQFVRKVALDQP